MIFDFTNSNQSEKEKARIYLEEVIKDCKVIRIEEVKPLRSNSQNRYLHVLFALFGIKFGLTIEEAKEAVKMALDYTYEKKGKKFFRQTSKMDTGELSEFIDKFRNFSNEHGCYLPTADEYNGKYIYFETEIEKHKNYLK